MLSVGVLIVVPKSRLLVRYRYDLCSAGADMTNAVLDRVDFSDANLEKVNFTNAVITGAKFAGAKLDGATYDDALIGQEDYKQL